MNTYKLQITFDSGRTKEFQVSGTRHAGNLLHKMDGYWTHARLHVEPGPVVLWPGKYGFLFDRNNTHY